MDKGDFIIGSISTEQVLQAVCMAVAMGGNGDLGVAVPDYVDKNVSTKGLQRNNLFYEFQKTKAKLAVLF